jgi:ubiquinone/menaquinone biosynthesis C-methylase UbiE
MRTKQSNKKHWESFWAAREKAEEIYSNADRISAQIEKITQVEGTRVLEVGAGTGRDGITLAEAGAKVVLLDYADQSLRMMKAHANREGIQVLLVKGDALALPFKQNSFDVVFHQGLLEHFRDPVPLLAENFRVARRGGYAVVDVPQKYHIYTLLKHVLIALNAWFAGWETEFSVHRLRKLLGATGFTVLKTYGDWMHPSLAYRIVREALKKVKIRLPMYPKGPALLRKTRQRIRTCLKNKSVLLNTCLDIGVVAEKPPVPSP